MTDGKREAEIKSLKITGRCIDLAKHAIGLDQNNPYHRHGKAFFKPYRNYFTTNKYDDDWCAWNEMCRIGLAKRGEDTMHEYFWLTRAGLDWLGEKLNIKIYDAK